MTEIEAKALALVNEIELERGATPYSKLNRHGGAEAIYRAIEQHEAFKQEVSDAVEAYLNPNNRIYSHSLNRFIIPKPKPKPDPLVEVCKEWWDMDIREDDAETLRALLEAHGLEIREKGQ
jgi:hypothetical protein